MKKKKQRIYYGSLALLEEKRQNEKTIADAQTEITAQALIEYDPCGKKALDIAEKYTKKRR